MNEINNILNGMQSVSLEDMQSVQLQNRIDTKFVFHRRLLPEILLKMRSNYAVFEIENQRICAYESIYFDTEGLQFYLDHHNRKNHRIKVRKRRYTSNGLSFFEIKEKRAGRTIKKRIPTETFTNDLTTEEERFLADEWKTKLNLQVAIQNHYYRITLVDHAKTERITLDLQIRFTKESQSQELDYLVIAELKQGKINRGSAFFELMREMKIAPFRISKYCIGSLFLQEEDKIKYNRFKRKLLKLKKIANDFE
jgi:hypothetical protein